MPVRGKSTPLEIIRHHELCSPHEVKLAESILVQIVIPEPPQNLIGDNAYARNDARELRQAPSILITATAWDN